MLIFYSIPNPDKLLSLVDESKGDVFLRLPDGGECNLKQEHIAREMLRVLTPGEDGVKIDVSNPADAILFLMYMMECQRPAKSA